MRHSLAAAVSVTLFAVTLAGCGKFGTPSAHVAATSASSLRVEASVPTRKDLAHFSTQPARIEAYESTPVYSKIAGYVENVAVDIGDLVQKGDLLMKLSVPEMQDDLEQSEALVAQAEAEIRQSEAAVSAAQAEIQTSQAKREQALSGVDAAAAVRTRWESEYKRIAELVAGGSVTRKLADETVSQYRAAEASVKHANATVAAADAALAQAKVNVTKAEADLDAVKARLRVAKANLGRVKTMLAYTEIRSPFAGVVTRREVDTGHFVQPASGNSKPLLIVSNTGRIRVFVDIPETEAAMVQGGSGGDAAVIRVQALNDQEFQAQVTRTAWSLDSSNRSLRIEIEIANDHGLLRPGMFSTAKILLDKRDNALAVPAAAVTRHGNDFFCCRVENGVIHRQRVQLGIRSGDDCEVISGIRDTDVIVLARTEALEEGQSVEVASPEAK